MRAAMPCHLVITELQTLLAGGRPITTIEMRHSRDGRRCEYRAIMPEPSGLRDITRAVATVTAWPLGRSGGLLVGSFGYDVTHQIAAALSEALACLVLVQPLAA